MIPNAFVCRAQHDRVLNKPEALVRFFSVLCQRYPTRKIQLGARSGVGRVRGPQPTNARNLKTELCDISEFALSFVVVRTGSHPVFCEWIICTSALLEFTVFLLMRVLLRPHQPCTRTVRPVRVSFVCNKERASFAMFMLVDSLHACFVCQFWTRFLCFVLSTCFPWLVSFCRKQKNFTQVARKNFALTKTCVFQIESRKLDFKDKAASKVGSKANLKHQAGGGDKKVLVLTKIQGKRDCEHYVSGLAKIS